jgi:hypothetical protein
MLHQLIGRRTYVHLHNDFFADRVIMPQIQALGTPLSRGTVSFSIVEGPGEGGEFTVAIVEPKHMIS